MLAAALTAAAGPASDTPADDAPLLDVIAGRRGELQSQAPALGRRFYAERPKACRRRLAAYLAAARAGEAVEQPA